MQKPAAAQECVESPWKDNLPSWQQLVSSWVHQSDWCLQAAEHLKAACSNLYRPCTFSPGKYSKSFAFLRIQSDITSIRKLFSCTTSWHWMHRSCAGSVNLSKYIKSIPLKTTVSISIPYSSLSFPNHPGEQASHIVLDWILHPSFVGQIGEYQEHLLRQLDQTNIRIENKDCAKNTSCPPSESGFLPMASWLLLLFPLFFIPCAASSLSLSLSKLGELCITRSCQYWNGVLPVDNIHLCM